MSAHALRVLRSWDEVEAMGAGWNALLPANPHRNFFMSLDRLLILRKHESDCEPHVLIFSEGGHDIGMVTLARCTRRKSKLTVRTLELLGGRTMEFASVPLPPDRPDLVALTFDHLQSEKWDVLWLEELQAEDPVTQNFMSEAAKRGLATESYITALAPYLPIDRTFEQLWTGLFDSKSRNTRMRKIRQAEKTEGLTLHHWKAGEPLEETLRDIAALEQISWKGGEAVGLFAPAWAEWNRDLIQTMAARDQCDLRWARLNGQLVSYRVGFIWEDVYYDYNTAYHPDAAKLSISSVLLHHDIEDLAARGVRRIEFNRGVQRYKLEWAQGLRENRLVRIYNKTAKARVLRGLAGAKSKIRGARSTERPELPIPLKAPLPPISLV